MKAFIKILFIGLVIFVAVCFFMVFTTNNSSSGAAPITDGSQARSVAMRPMSVSALKLFMDYQNNEVAADNAYKGHLLAVRGLVTSINKDMFGKIYLTLATPNEFMNVQAHLDVATAAQAATLQRGQLITVVCTGAGLIVGSPMLDNCSFANAQSEMSERSLPGPGQQLQPSVEETGTASINPSYAPIQNGDVANSSESQAKNTATIPALISSVDPEYPEAAISHGVGATVTVHLIVDRSGFPINVRAIRTVYVDRDGHASSAPNGVSGSLGFNESAVEAVRNYKFRPATKNGDPESVELNVEVEFQPS